MFYNISIYYFIIRELEMHFFQINIDIKISIEYSWPRTIHTIYAVVKSVIYAYIDVWSIYIKLILNIW